MLHKMFEMLTEARCLTGDKLLHGGVAGGVSEAGMEDRRVHSGRVTLERSLPEG